MRCDESPCLNVYIWRYTYVVGGLDWVLMSVSWLGLGHYRAKRIENKPILDISIKKPITSVSDEKAACAAMLSAGNLLTSQLTSSKWRSREWHSIGCCWRVQKMRWSAQRASRNSTNFKIHRRSTDFVNETAITAWSHRNSVTLRKMLCMSIF